jgi:hypothetical protein
MLSVMGYANAEVRVWNLREIDLLLVMRPRTKTCWKPSCLESPARDRTQVADQVVRSMSQILGQGHQER